MTVAHVSLSPHHQYITQIRLLLQQLLEKQKNGLWNWLVLTFFAEVYLCRTFQCFVVAAVLMVNFVTDIQEEFWLAEP